MSRIRQKLGKRLPSSVKLPLKAMLAGLTRKRRGLKPPPGFVSSYSEHLDGSSPVKKMRDLLSAKAAPLRPAASERNFRTSIVIPVFNQAAFTFYCLRSLIEELNWAETEVIVVNNASTDETHELLSLLREFVTVLDNDENRGFVEACNQGAAAAGGNYLVFLNNDTVVQPGWLKHLIETVERDEGVGAVGSMLIYPNGKIQEAGGIIWNRGEALHYGWGQPIGEGAYNFAREVDYCSAASLLVRRDLFRQLGGFDLRYAPAYYEDVDLCFGVRSLGSKVIYQPFSRVVHFEGTTAGTDTNTGFKRYQVINRQKFLEKWRDVLEREQLEQDAVSLDAAANRTPGLQILVCDDRVPAVERDAGSARMFLILKSLLKVGRPLFISMSNLPQPEYENELRKEGVETASWTNYKQLLRDRRFDVAVLSRPDVASALIKPIKKISPRTRIVFDTVDISFVRLGREYKLNADQKIARASEGYRKLEAQLARASDQVWCVTIEDQDSLSALAPTARFEIIPTIHPLQIREKDFAERRGVVFIGNYLHRPNEDAVHYFVREILPLVKTACDGFKLFIVGDHASPEMVAYASDDVIVTGYLPSVDEIFQNCRVFVAPLRFGSGMKGKIGQALSYGIPVVTTSIGAEGMGLENGCQAIIADGAQDFAVAVINVYQDAELWLRLSDNGMEHVRKNFTPEVVDEKIRRAVQNLIAETVPS